MVLAAAALGTFVPAPARAAPGMETILQDDARLLHRPTASVEQDMVAIRALGVDRVRLTANWSAIAPEADSSTRPGFDATDPSAYPAHRWDRLDTAVRLAEAHGLSVDIDIAFWAPLWATSAPQAGMARLNINAADFARFAQAVARRYSGSYAPPDESRVPPPPPSGDESLLDSLSGVGRTEAGSGQGTQPVPVAPPLGGLPVGGLLGRSAGAAQSRLPRVDMYTLWNEPNDPTFLEPQFPANGERSSADVYRAMVDGGYRAIKGVDRLATVLIGGTSPTGSDGSNPEAGTAPLRFLRRLACVDDRLRPVNDGDCAHYAPIRGDGWAHHPYSLDKPPNMPDRHASNVTIADLSRLTGLLGVLVRRHRIDPRLRDVWITEFGYEDNSLVREKPFTATEQARFIPWSEYLAWRNPRVRSFAQFLLRDVETQSAIAHHGRDRLLGSWQSGLYYENGAPKPAARSFALSLWSQSGAPPKPRIARGSQRARKPARRSRFALIWGHVRLAGRPLAIRLAQPGASASSWRLIGGPPTRRRRRGPQLYTDPRGYFGVRIPYPRRGQVRVQYRSVSGWVTAGTVTANR